ncbi:MAG: AAA family ATPase [Acidobacteriaceae bacterium]|jgi:DNA polymerase III delta prime subunit|nr:AAA family ATPase [Acidobacteriaceae bacterium]
MGSCGATLAGGRSAAIGRGESLVEFCFDHFEMRSEKNRDAVFVLHAVGVDEEGRTAAFALLHVDGVAQYFTARWGRSGVGSHHFGPIPVPVEEDERPGIMVYGSRACTFTWRSHQWEITGVQSAPQFEFPALEGETLVEPWNLRNAWALRDGRPVCDVDELADGEHGELTKDPESAESYRVRFGGRIWRRWRHRHTGKQSVELLAFDIAAAEIEASLEEVWSEIGGQEEAKRELVRAIQWPVLYPELFMLFKRRRSRGVLLYGPPGCGKTLLGKAVVKLLAALYRRKADDGGFQYVKGHQLLDQYVGNSEKGVKALFDRARRWKEDKGYPAVLFFDEADALFKRRPQGDASFTLVPALLAEMDGMDESGAFLILATNRPDALDLAVTRPGRVDRKIRITRPDESGCERIFAIHLDGVFLAEGLTREGLSAAAARELFSTAHRLYDVEWEDGTQEGFLLKDLASGALVQNIVDRATANKMEHCIENGVREGLDVADLARAIDEVQAEQLLSNHTEEVAEFAESRRRRIADVRKAGL